MFPWEGSQAPRPPSHLQAQGLVIALHVCQMCCCAQGGAWGEEGQKHPEIPALFVPRCL